MGKTTRRSPAQKQATKENFAIFKLRGMKGQLEVLSYHDKVLSNDTSLQIKHLIDNAIMEIKDKQKARKNAK